MMKSVKTAQEIANELARMRSQEFTAFGKKWSGDIFYSWIWDRVKLLPASVRDSTYREVVDALRNKGYYIHSNPIEPGTAPGTVVYRPGRTVVFSWGYEQTNIDFYLITKRSGDYVTLTERESNEVPTPNAPWATGRVVAGSVKRGTKPFRRKVHKDRQGNEIGIAIKSYGWASLWDGSPQSYTAYANPTPNMKLAKEMRARYRGDVKAGHNDAAEYWRGQAAAYFTGNPKTFVCPVEGKKFSDYTKASEHWRKHHSMTIGPMPPLPRMFSIEGAFYLRRGHWPSEQELTLIRKGGAFSLNNPNKIRWSRTEVNWNKELAFAYNEGLKDARTGQPNQSERYEFKAAYDQGYRHGNNRR